MYEYHTAQLFSSYGSVFQVPPPTFPLLVHAAAHLLFANPPSPINRNWQVNRGIDSTILLRDVINGNSVESHIPLFSPLIESIEVSYDCNFPVSLGIMAIFCGRGKHIYESMACFEPKGCSYQEFSAGVTPLYN